MIWFAILAAVLFVALLAFGLVCRLAGHTLAFLLMTLIGDRRK